MSSIIALDPGTTRTAWVLWDGAIRRHGIEPNIDILELLRRGMGEPIDVLAIEMIASYGMPVGAEVFETCVWIGRFVQAWGRPHRRVLRSEVKLELCGSQRAKDANVRQALIDRIGPPGTKKAPGPTYGLRADEWSALGVAVTVAASKGKLAKELADA